VLKVVGLGESRVGERLADFMATGGNPTVGTLAHLGQVDVRIAAKADDRLAAERLIAPVEAEIRARLGEAVFGADADTLESVVGGRLRALGTRAALVEVGTAGSAAERLASAVPDRLAVALVAASPEGLAPLRVDPDNRDGPLDRALAAASAVARWAGVDVGAAAWLEDVVGSAPPIARAAIAVAVGGRATGREHRVGGDRTSVRIRAGTLLLDELRRALLARGS